MSHSARSWVWKFVAGSVLLVAGCGTPEAFHDITLLRDGSVGVGTGGAIVPPTGGVSGGTGGASLGTGGAITGTGGGTATGGRIGTGGTTASGGRVGTGGTTASGGTPGTGGRVGSGGTTASGGTTGTGGRVGTGGTTASGGTTGTGGRVGSGGATGTGGMATGVLFMDNFESGAGKWIAQPAGDWSIVADGSMVYREGVTPPTHDWRTAAAGNAAWTDIVVEARIKILAFNGSGSGYFAGVCARVRDANNRYCFALRSDLKIAIRKTINGSSTSGASVNVPGDLALNTWYTARIRVVGSAITGTLLMNGTQIATATDSDSSVTAGGIALGTDNASAVFDDVLATSP